MIVQSPFGRYAPLAAAVAALAILATALLPRVLAGFSGVGATPDPFVDNLAFLAVGVLFGQQVGLSAGREQGVMEATAKINGLQREVAAAHHRLDAAGAPPADDQDPEPTRER